MRDPDGYLMEVSQSTGLLHGKLAVKALGGPPGSALSTGRDPHGGDLYIFRGRRGDLIKILWHDGLGMSLYAKRLEHGRFIWPSPADGIVSITPAQLAYLLEGIDWRNPRHSFRPELAG